MKAHMMRLFKGTFIYSSGQLLARVITFFLLPLTTSYLKPEDYGIIGTLAIIGQLFSGLFTLGFGVSLSRCYWSTEDTSARHGMIWSSFLALLLNSAVLIAFTAFFARDISWIALGSSQYSGLVILTFISIGLASSLLPFASYFRMEEKAVLVVTLTIIELIISLSLTIYFVMFLYMGALGVVLGGLIAQAASFVLMLVIASRHLSSLLTWFYLPDMIKIGYPYIFVLFGNFLLQCSSRYILQFYEGMDQVGLFFMGSNFANIITLAVTGFISAWPPFFNSFLNKQDEAVKVFGRVLSYYSMGMGAIVILFFALARPIVHLMVQPPFYSVWTVVGTLAAAQALMGVYSISAAGLIFYKKSGWQVLLEIGAGLISIALNFLLIPLFEKEGAALATLLSFLALVTMSLLINQRLLPVQYEKMRVFKVTASLAIAALITFLPIQSELAYNCLMVLTVLSFYCYLWKYCLNLSERNSLLHYFPMGKIKMESLDNG